MTLPELTHSLLQTDHGTLPPGPLPFPHSKAVQLHAVALDLPRFGGMYVPVAHPSWDERGCFQVIQRGTGQYIETLGSSPQQENRLLVFGDEGWRDYRVRAVVTPLDEAGDDTVNGLAGVIARYVDADNYVALVLDRDRQMKLLQRTNGVFEVLAARPLEFCLGQSLTLALTVTGSELTGSAGPYSGPTTIAAKLRAPLNGGRAGFIASMHARLGPVNIESTPAEAARVKDAKASWNTATIKAPLAPPMKLARTVPLHGLVNGRNLRVVDLNNDGKPEIVVAQASEKIARQISMTRLTCLSVLDLDGKLLWQAGVPDPDAPLYHGELPFQIHDLFGDGGKVVVCVFGYDIQIRDGKSGKVLFSACAPDTVPMGADFKEVASNHGANWGDESLYMNIAALAFSNTQGSSGAREIVVKDDYHHLAVLDTGLQPLFRHRGNHGRFPWIGDLDGDGRDEILAGATLLDDNGVRQWSLPLAEPQQGIAVADLLNAGGAHKQIFYAAGNEGLVILNPTGQTRAFGRVGARTAPAARLSIARFRGDIPGLQIATAAGGATPGIVRLYDGSGRLLWSREALPLGGVVAPVNWTGRAEELILTTLAPGGGLLNGYGDLIVAAPKDAPVGFCDTSSALSPDGRDALLAWDAQRLAVYIPDDALSKPAYKPRRPGLENYSSYRAQVSLPPDW